LVDRKVTRIAEGLLFEREEELDRGDESVRRASGPRFKERMAKSSGAWLARHIRLGPRSLWGFSQTRTMPRRALRLGHRHAWLPARLGLPDVRRRRIGARASAAARSSVYHREPVKAKLLCELAVRVTKECVPRCGQRTNRLELSRFSIIVVCVEKEDAGRVPCAGAVGGANGTT
jgi:hypothetical protein